MDEFFKYLYAIHLSKILSFEHIINMKIINEISYSPSFHTKSSEFSVFFILIALINLE